MSFSVNLLTVAGRGDENFSGDRGSSILATFNRPNGIAIDSFDNIYIADTFNNRIRKIDNATKTIVTVAGTGFKGGDEGDEALEVNLNWPIGIAIGTYS